ncbi:MAG: CRTAC1 family protein [Chloroflexi bacterium]|nr:CRTAC1 family protein [Chloroflexota bacterium]
MKRRTFLLGAAGALTLSGCKTKPAQPTLSLPGLSLPSAPTTIIDRTQAAAAAPVTAHPVRFTDVSGPAGIHWKYENGATGRHFYIETVGGGVALFDHNNNGLLDIFAVQGGPVPGAVGKERLFSTASAFYRNNGDGTFTDVSQRAGISKLPGKSMGAAWLDYDDDGWMDLFVTNDTMPNFLLHNNRDGTFSDVAMGAGVAVGSSGAPMSGMGLAVGDYKNDGREDLFVVNFSGEPKSVLENGGGGSFADRSYDSDIASSNLQFLGFGLECFDYDLDGYLDLVNANGHVLDDPKALGTTTYAQSSQLFHNQHSGKFAEDLKSLGDLVQPVVGRGLAVGDLDNDGDVDIVMVAQNSPMRLLRNDGGNANHWITFRLEGVHSNRDAIGAKVTVRSANLTQSRSVRSGSSYCSHSDVRLTFGLASETSVHGVDVRWPRGLVQRFGPLAANRFYWIKEGAAPVPDPRIHAAPQAVPVSPSITTP